MEGPCEPVRPGAHSYAGRPRGLLFNESTRFYLIHMPRKLFCNEQNQYCIGPL